jgi:hypothetical protein
MDVRFVSPELSNLDALRCEAILAPFFSDERPLRGVLGLLDWRLCGFLSQAIVRGFVQGERGEVALVPLRPRFTVDKLFLFGLGPSAQLDASMLTDVTARMLDVVTQAKVRTAAIVLPGRSTAQVQPMAAMESFVLASKTHGLQDEVILLEPPEAQREMDPIVQRERRRARVTDG